MIEYQSREFCEDVECEIQKIIDEDNISLELGFAKGYCINKCEAYKFHKWLQENNYKILKERILDEHQEMDSEFELIAEMIENTPEDSGKAVLNQVLDDIKDIADNNYGKWRNVEDVE